MTSEGAQRVRIDRVLADWRDAQRAADEARSQREAAEQVAVTVEKVDEAVRQTATHASESAEAAARAEQAALEAAAVVEEVNRAAQEELEQTRSAEDAARLAEDEARARHREAQEGAVRRYRTGDGGPGTAEASTDGAGADPAAGASVEAVDPPEASRSATAALLGWTSARRDG